MEASMETKQEQTEKSTQWRYVEPSQWILCSNNFYTLPQEEEKKTKDPKANTAFQYSTKRLETKGSFVYTPDGQGIVQDFKNEGKTVEVKVQNKISPQDKLDIQFDIPLSLTIISISFTSERVMYFPLSSTTKDLLENVESSVDIKGIFSCDIFFEGRQVKSGHTTLHQLGLKPFAKLLVIFSQGKAQTVNRFNKINQGWGQSNSIDGISFSVSRNIFFIGFGIQGPDREARTLTGVGKLVAGNDAKGAVILEKDFSVDYFANDVDKKIYKLHFDRPHRILSGETYSIVLEVENGNSFYGANGQVKVTGEQEVVFNFSECNGSFNGTGTSSGQLPEIYYYL